jgi:large subunit ribosomal protein L11
MDIKFKIIIYIRANSADAGPPLGTTLGNIGINALKFCKEFNEFTQDLPNYFLVKVEIKIFENKSYTFLLFLPSIGYFLSILKKEEIIKDQNGYIYNIQYIDSIEFFKLVKFILPTYPLQKATSIIYGTLLAAGITLRI